jgi:hypothetical protein
MSKLNLRGKRALLTGAEMYSSHHYLFPNQDHTEALVCTWFRVLSSLLFVPLLPSPSELRLLLCFGSWDDAPSRL